MQSLRFYKTSKVMEANHEPSTNPCPQVPHPHCCWTPPQGWGLTLPGSSQGKFPPLQQGLNPLFTWFYPHSHTTDPTTPPEPMERCEFPLFPTKPCRTDTRTKQHQPFRELSFHTAQFCV